MRCSAISTQKRSPPSKNLVCLQLGKAKGDLAAAEFAAAESAALLREVVEGRCETLGNRHPDTLGSIDHLDILLEAKGDLGAA